MFSMALMIGWENFMIRAMMSRGVNTMPITSAPYGYGVY